MITDKLCTLSNEQAVTTDAVSTDSFDLVVDGRDIGLGEELTVLFTVDTTFDSAGDTATLNVQIISDDQADLAGSPTVLAETGAIAEATLVAGYQFEVKVPSGIPSGDRYLGVNYDNETEAFTAGAISAAIIHTKQDSKQYASGFTVA